MSVKTEMGEAQAYAQDEVGVLELKPEGKETLFVYRAAIRTFENVERVRSGESMGRGILRLQHLYDAAYKGSRLADVKEIVTFWPESGGYEDKAYLIERARQAWGAANVIGIVKVEVEVVEFMVVKKVGS